MNRMSIKYIKTKEKRMLLINAIPFIVFFIVILYFGYGTTIMADDVRYLHLSSFNGILPVERINSLFDSIASAVADWKVWNGRIVTTIITTTILRFDRYLWLVLNPIIVTLTFYYGLRLANGSKFNRWRDLIINTLCLFAFFQITRILIDECVFWITGSIFYCWSALAGIIVVRLFLDKDNKRKWYHYITYCFLGLWIGFSIENLAAAIFGVVLLITLYNFCYKKDKQFLTPTRIVTLSSILIALIIHVLSPSIRLRTNNENISLMSKLSASSVYYANHQYLESNMIIVVLMIALVVYVSKHNIVISIIASIICFPYIVVMSYLILIPGSYSELINNRYAAYLIDFANYVSYNPSDRFMKYLFLVYYGLVTLALASIIIYLFVKEKDERMFFTLILGTIPNIIMLVLGKNDSRPAFFTQLFMIFGIAVLFYKMDIKKPSTIILVALLAIGNIKLMIDTFDSYIDNVRVGTIRQEIYEDVIEHNDGKDVVIPRYAFSVHGNFENTYTWENAEFRNNYLHLKASQALLFVDLR